MAEHNTFAGQVAVITGAGVGIGKEIAQQLALQGCAVLINDIDPALLQATADEIRAQGGTVESFPGDAGDVATVQQMVTNAVDHFGRLDVAVANAGLTVWGSIFDYTPQMFEQLVAVNLRGSYFLTQAAARQMRQQGHGGRILLMSSVTAHQAIRFLSGYAMTKAALEMLARNLVLELSPYGITINCVAPGATVTPRNLADDPEYEAVWSKVTPRGRPASTMDIAAAALFLLSPAAAHITGQSLVVDGGWTCVSETPHFHFVQTE
ncbi:MAG: SDR family oxidoreductase [Anaerolineae bacterium]|nr:SDR family oxidoreductase [Anaerolineae bacterium]